MPPRPAKWACSTTRARVIMYIIDMAARAALVLLVSLVCLAAPVFADDYSPAPFVRPVFVNPMPAHLSYYWWRNFRDPSYCRMVLCNASCAFAGESAHSGCALVPMFPILQTQDCCQDSACDSHSGLVRIG